MKLCSREECTGCSACINVCPKKAISLQYDERGFLRPIVDESRCVNCNICSKLCEKLKQHMLEANHSTNFFQAFACKIKDDKKRMQSQSGGLFAALAETIIEKEGVVYGAGFDKNHHVQHFRITALDELNKIKGSKYVQSDINNSFESIINDLNNKKIVLFSGTPCQVAGIETLLDYKKIDKDNFFSCDLICHGVPSPKVYENFICLLEENKGAKIKEFNFRDKVVNGWKSHVETYRFQHGRFQQGDEHGDKIVTTIYGDLFYSNLALRQSCEHCKYASKNRPGDLTMADCWGIEKIKPDLWNDNKGISICLIQTQQGKKLFEMSNDKLDIYEIDAKTYSQPNMEHSSSVPYQKEHFWKDYKKMKFDKFMKKYTIYGGKKFKLKRKLLRLINRW